MSEGKRFRIIIEGVGHELNDSLVSLAKGFVEGIKVAGHELKVAAMDMEHWVEGHDLLAEAPVPVAIEQELVKSVESSPPEESPQPPAVDAAANVTTAAGTETAASSVAAPATAGDAPPADSAGAPVPPAGDAPSEAKPSDTSA